MKKTACGIIMTLLLMAMLTFAFDIQPVKTQPSVITVPDDYPTIQDAIANANEGDTIIVRKGTYYEHVTVNKIVSLVGEDKSITIIDGGGGGTLFNVLSNGTVIANFTLQNAGVGIYADHCWGRIFENILVNNEVGISLLHSRAGYGGVYRNTFSNNKVGMKLDESDNKMISTNTFSNNNIGIEFNQSFDSALFRNNFIDNAKHVSSVDSRNRWWQSIGWGASLTGNYWSNYSGVDNFGGRFQNETGSDYIGDAPYNVTSQELVVSVDYTDYSTYDIDYYPFMSPWRDHGWEWGIEDGEVWTMWPRWTKPLQLEDSFVVTGLVENELNMTYLELLSFPLWTENATIICDPLPGKQHLHITCNWTGVPLCYLLNLAKIKPNAKEVIFRAADNFYSSLDIETAMDPHVLVALEVNGTLLSEALRANINETDPWGGAGRPLWWLQLLHSGFRLVVPEYYGYKWTKNIVQILVVDYYAIGTYEDIFEDIGKIPNYTSPSLVSYEMVVAKGFEPETVDPAWAYDDASCELIANVYETLIRFERTDIKDNFYDFVPCLATDWTISEDGLTYTFTIREGVPWHNSSYGFLTAKDVEYSFERAMVHDKDPAWLLYEPLLGTYEANLTDPIIQGRAIDDAVSVDGNAVSFHLKRPDTPYASYTPFIRILAQPICSQIVCKQWCIDQGDWPGFNPMALVSYLDWVNYHDLEVSPLDDPEPVMMGTGPYMLDYWDKGVEYSLIKFDDYWEGWPCPLRFQELERATVKKIDVQRIRGWVERVTVKKIEEWASRKEGFLIGAYDIVDVPRGYINEVFCEPGIDCIYPLWPLFVEGILFKYNISITSPFLGLGFDPANPYAFGEDRIRIDFFSDLNVRKAFAYSFDGTELIQQVYQCEAVERPTPVVPDLPYYNSSIPIYGFDLAKAEEYFRYAWSGELWEQGFTFTIAFNVGNVQRRKVCEIIKANVESLNPKFHIECVEIMWWIYINHLNNCELPMFKLGWCADYPDPHTFVHTFMHNEGAFASHQHIQYGQSELKQIPPYGDPTLDINNAYVGTLIEAGLTTPDGDERERIYNELQQIYHEECLSVFLCQPIHRHFERTGVNGWYFNRETCGHYLYFYTMWKENLPLEDVNEDGTVNILDIAIAALAFGSVYRLCEDIHPRWNSRADIYCDQKVNILDIAGIATKYGQKVPPWMPPWP